MVANIATRPCLISVSRRLNTWDQLSSIVISRKACARHHHYVTMSHQEIRFLSLLVLLSRYVKMKFVYVCPQPLEDLHILVFGKTKGVPEAEGCLITHKAFEALALLSLLHSKLMILMKMNQQVQCGSVAAFKGNPSASFQLHRNRMISFETAEMLQTLQQRHCISGSHRSLASPTLAKCCSQGFSDRCAGESRCTGPSLPRRSQSGHPGRT